MHESGWGHFLLTKRVSGDLFSCDTIEPVERALLGRPALSGIRTYPRIIINRV